MIASSVVQEVRRLLAQGEFSQRKIARIAGISRGTVGAIAAGKRSDRVRLRRAVEDESREPVGPLQRCPGCGGMVYMPCSLCRARALKAGSSKLPIRAWLKQPDEPLGLDLKEEDRARYEEILMRRESASDCQARREVARPGEGPRDEREERGDGLEIEDEDWELDPADLWDALEWEDEEPAIDYESVAAYDERLLPDSV